MRFKDEKCGLLRWMVRVLNVILSFLSAGICFNALRDIVSPLQGDAILLVKTCAAVICYFMLATSGALVAVFMAPPPRQRLWVDALAVGNGIVMVLLLIASEASSELDSFSVISVPLVYTIVTICAIVILLDDIRASRGYK
jgi:hypothetical protein